MNAEIWICPVSLGIFFWAGNGRLVVVCCPCPRNNKICIFPCDSPGPLSCHPWQKKEDYDHVSWSLTETGQLKPGPAWWVTAQGSDILSGGRWRGELVISESFYFKQSEQPSQLNIFKCSKKFLKHDLDVLKGMSSFPRGSISCLSNLPADNLVISLSASRNQFKQTRCSSWVMLDGHVSSQTVLLLSRGKFLFVLVSNIFKRRAYLQRMCEKPNQFQIILSGNVTTLLAPAPRINSWQVWKMPSTHPYNSSPYPPADLFP